MRCCSTDINTESGMLMSWHTRSSGYPDGMARRSDTLTRLRSLAREERRLDKRRIAAVARARADGESWASIAHALGMTKQSAWEYFTDRLRVELSRQPGADLSESAALRLAVGETKRSRHSKHR